MKIDPFLYSYYVQQFVLQYAVVSRRSRSRVNQFCMKKRTQHAFLKYPLLFFT